MSLGILFAITPDHRFHFEKGFPWSVPGYLDYFNATISNNPIIMGSGTWDYLGRERIPGNDSLHILVSHKEQYCDKNCISPEDWDRVLDIVDDSECDMIWFVGGSELITNNLLDASVVRIAYLNEGVYDKEAYKLNPSVMKYCKGTASSEEVVFKAQDFHVVEYRFTD